MGKSLLERNIFKNVLILGIDTVSNFVLSGFQGLGALSQEKCRPFDTRRSGVNLGEAAVCAILSNTDGGNEIVGHASASDAEHTVAPSRTAIGLTKTVNKCLKQSNSFPDFISAHGTATRYNDEMEALCINNCGLENVPLFSLKSYFGHTLGAAGLLETILPLRAMEDNRIFSSLRCDNPGTDHSVNIAGNNVQGKLCQSFLKTSSGFGGVNASIIIRSE